MSRGLKIRSKTCEHRKGQEGSGSAADGDGHKPDLSGGFISVADTVLKLQDGATFLTFEGLSFAHARGTIFTTDVNASVSNITVRNCTISNGGGGGPIQ